MKQVFFQKCDSALIRDAKVSQDFSRSFVNIMKLIEKTTSIAIPVTYA